MGRRSKSKTAAVGQLAAVWAMTGCPTDEEPATAESSAASDSSAGAQTRGESDVSSGEVASESTAGQPASTGDVGDTTAAADSGADSIGGTGATTGAVGPGDVAMYEACTEDSDCLEGLGCTIFSFMPFVQACTAMCDAKAQMNGCDAPPESWVPVCAAFSHRGIEPFCAIGCSEESGCPEGMKCGVEIPFSMPYYCYPA